MPSTTWSKLNHMQLGRYAEYYAKMEFASYGWDVYTSEVDDHGIDFVARPPQSKCYYEIQVKSCRNYSYVFMTKEKMPISDTRLICYLHFENGKMPDLYVIPSKAWENPNAVLVDRPYDKPNQKSAPEWGINISKTKIALLEPYRTEKFFAEFIRNEIEK